ncbi:Zinc finger, GATA-type [Artemisia annua]|uniref:Zinc finger, GATA-type n=1 Tax=Artemisia annua TaxID=35608 RepID=A0A2U1PI30_ARTAN|nr:Zinc finger, GATA-type [Artemisia annua]
MHQPNSFSMLLTMPYDQHTYPYGSSSSSVDCTLSLGTPSTRLTSSDESSRFCWDFLNSGDDSSPPGLNKSSRGGATNVATVESLLTRRCANCDTTSTPLWRNGPRGPKSLCNACGIRFKKEERRANATTTTVANGGDTTEMYNNTTWMHHTQPSSHKLPTYYTPSAAVGSHEFRFIHDDVDDRDSTFLSWRLNVTDRPGLVHDFTRY